MPRLVDAHVIGSTHLPWITCESRKAFLGAEAGADVEGALMVKETICSLAFAARCRDVELGAALARPEAAELMRAKQEIRALKARLDRLALAAK